MSAQTIDVDDVTLGIGNQGPIKGFNNFLDSSIDGGLSTGFIPAASNMSPN